MARSLNLLSLAVDNSEWTAWPVLTAGAGEDQDKELEPGSYRIGNGEWSPTMGTPFIVGRGGDLSAPTRIQWQVICPVFSVRSYGHRINRGTLPDNVTVYKLNEAIYDGCVVEAVFGGGETRVCFPGVPVEAIAVEALTGVVLFEGLQPHGDVYDIANHAVTARVIL